MSNIVPFKFKQSDIRTVVLDDEPMFVAKDVASILGYSNTSKAINTHCKGVKTCPTEMGGQVRHIQVIPERDVYRLIMRSKMPEAEKFEDWVVSDVLPSIRKTGSYQSTQPVIPQTLPEALRLAADLAEKLEEAKPKIAFAEAVNNSINSISIRDFAKVVNTGQNRLYDLLRNEGYLMASFKDRNKPYQKYIDAGYFKLQENVRRDQAGENVVWFKTLVTPKGQLYFQNKYFNEAA